MSKQNDKTKISGLISDVRRGDQKAFSRILEMYKPLMDSLVRKFCADGAVKPFEEDLRQEAVLVFYNSILTYDESQTEVEFGLYARICVSNALVSQLRSIKKRSAEQLTESGGTDMLPCTEGGDDPSERILEQENLKYLYSVIRSSLSDYEYRIWQYYMTGRTARDIGALIGKDEKSVSNAIYRIRVKLRKVLS
ncbi:MAG: sigma-70 family RNA polymerase sigma factor [Eubacteriales bacterium]